MTEMVDTKSNASAPKRSENSRQIVQRIVITGDLVLETPTHLGGTETGLADMALLTDSATGEAMLTGFTLAGAFRSYLRTRLHGYRSRETRNDAVEHLFGDRFDGDQSLLIVDHAYGGRPQIEIRDGVAIDPATRTAASKKKYDYELLEAGTRFGLRMELLIPEGKQKELCEALAIALQGLELGEIPLGLRRRRGFGKCRVENWALRKYDFAQPAHLADWLTGSEEAVAPAPPGTQIAALLLEKADLPESGLTEKRRCLTLDAKFAIDGSLLIRSGGDEAGAPDMVHLTSRRNGESAAIVSGTAWAGALRARARRILRTLDAADAFETLIDSLFGQEMKPGAQPVAGRLWVDESEIENPLSKVQTRVKIDRFTGGSYPGALFSEQPVFGGSQSRLPLSLHVENPTKADIGLLLLLLKDLWTGDLPIGGEAAVGRGRLKGINATLKIQSDDPDLPGSFEFALEGKTLRLPANAGRLESCLEALLTEVRRERSA